MQTSLARGLPGGRDVRSGLQKEARLLPGRGLPANIGSVLGRALHLNQQATPASAQALVCPRFSRATAAACAVVARRSCFGLGPHRRAAVKRFPGVPGVPRRPAARGAMRRGEAVTRDPPYEMLLGELWTRRLAPGAGPGAHATHKATAHLGPAT